MPAVGNPELSAHSPILALAAYLDIAGDQLRHCLAPVPIQTPASTILAQADPDFDNRLFTNLDPRVISVSPIAYGEGGTDGVEFVLSGSLEFDSGLLTALSDPSLFFGRIAKIWLVRLDEAYQPTHATPRFTGYMAVPSIAWDQGRQTILLRAENYLALRVGAPARSLLSQQEYDAGDLSAAATAGASRGEAAFGPGFVPSRLPYTFEQGVTWQV